MTGGLRTPAEEGGVGEKGAGVHGSTANAGHGPSAAHRDREVVRTPAKFCVTVPQLPNIVSP